MQTLARLKPLLAVAALALAGCAAVPSDAAVHSLADRVVDAAARDADFHGAVVLMRDGRVVYARGVGLAQRNPDRPYMPDTPSDGGSLAKTLTAASLLELAADGRVGLDDAVTKHLPGYPYAAQTVRGLVNHRNGLPDYDIADAELKAGRVVDTDALLRLVAAQRPQPVLAPGIAVEYSNIGFDAAARIVERTLGQPIGAHWRERWFGPLGMTSAFARPARFADWPGLRTPGYRRDGARWVDFDALDGEAFIGASNIHASALDWARWGDAWARGRALAPERVATGLAAATLVSGLDSNLNLLSWYCDAPRQRCHYTGAYNAFYAQVYWDRARGETLAWVSNSTLAPWRCARLTRDLVAALAGHAPANEQIDAPNRIPRGERPRWAGTYRSSSLGDIAIAIEFGADGRAAARVGRGERVSLFHTAGGVFYAPLLDLWFGFTGTPAEPTLHLRSVFHVAEARRADARAGLP